MLVLRYLLTAALALFSILRNVPADTLYSLGILTLGPIFNSFSIVPFPMHSGVVPSYQWDFAAPPPFKPTPAVVEDIYEVPTPSSVSVPSSSAHVTMGQSGGLKFIDAAPHMGAANIRMIELVAVMLILVVIPVVITTIFVFTSEDVDGQDLVNLGSGEANPFESVTPRSSVSASTTLAELPSIGKSEDLAHTDSYTIQFHSDDTLDDNAVDMKLLDVPELHKVIDPLAQLNAPYSEGLGLREVARESVSMADTQSTDCGAGGITAFPIAENENTATTDECPRPVAVESDLNAINIPDVTDDAIEDAGTPCSVDEDVSDVHKGGWTKVSYRRKKNLGYSAGDRARRLRMAGGSRPTPLPKRSTTKSTSRPGKKTRSN
ncbi:hypothetical protein AcW1_008798 [Taiwanofungus camphoratus]|nr:hypothetical protein AcW1_008798 [Antrodia cinnamomea]